MKSTYLAFAAAALIAGAFLIGQPRLTEAAPAGGAEYAMIQWKNDHDTQVIWSDGRVEFMATLLPGFSVPSGGVHERGYIMNALINKLAKQGYEYVGMASGEEIMMKKVH